MMCFLQHTRGYSGNCRVFEGIKVSVLPGACRKMPERGVHKVASAELGENKASITYPDAMGAMGGLVWAPTVWFHSVVRSANHLVGSGFCGHQNRPSGEVTTT